jgi:Trypsin-like peptidase domain
MVLALAHLEENDHMHAKCLAFVAGLMLSLICQGVNRADEPPRARTQLAKLGKAATALVELGDGRGPGVAQGHGSAFCIHDSGLFVTAEHVIHPPSPFPGNQPIGDSPITLILNPGQVSQKACAARVLRADKELDLALLRVEGLDKFPALYLGDDEKLEELMDVIAFGFPFGTGLARPGVAFPGQPQTSARREYPSVSVNAGSITALRRKDGKLDRIQLDATINPGNSGGPVLDKDGKVVGIVVSMAVAQGLGRTGISHAIPVSHLKRFLARPDIDFDPPVLTPANMHKLVLFEAKVVPLVPSAAPLTVDLILKPARGREQSHRLEAAGTSYRVHTVPLPPPSGPARVRVLAQFENGLLNALAPDQAFKVGDKSVQFSEVRSIQLKPALRVALHQGKALEGPVSGLEAVPVQLGDQALAVNLAKAEEVKFGPAVESDQVSYTLLVRQGDHEIFRQTESLLIQGLLPMPATAAGPSGIRRPTLEGNPAVRKLPAPVADVAVGGAGRFLVLHLPSLHKLAVFDVNAADIVGYIPVKEDNAHFAAAREHVVVLLPGAGTMERWRLPTLEREEAVPLPIKGSIQAVAMGAASTGPLLVRWAPVGEANFINCRFSLISVDTMKMVQGEVPIAPHMQHLTMVRDVIHLRASANGKVFGMWCTSHSPSGVGVIVASDAGLQAYYAHWSAGFVVPSPDGKWLCTGSGRYLPQVSLTSIPGARSDPVLPASDGDYCLGLPPNSARGQGPLRPLPGRRGAPQPNQAPAAKASTVTVRTLSTDKLIATVPGLDLFTGGEDSIKTDLTLDKRVHLVPEARLVITIPATNDRLVLYGYGG